jgi:hypothetical protein
MLPTSQLSSFILPGAIIVAAILLGSYISTTDNKPKQPIMPLSSAILGLTDGS